VKNRLLSLLRSGENWPGWASALVTLFGGSLLIALGLTRVWSDPVSDRFNGLSPWWFLVPLAVASIAMLARSRRPLLALAIVIVALAIDFLLGGSVGVPLAFVDLLFSAALRTTPTAQRRLNRAAVAIIVVPVIVVLAMTGSARFGLIIGFQLFLIIGTPLWWAFDVRRGREIAELAARRAADLERISELSRDNAVASERAVMARELHDVVASHLSAIAIRSAAAVSTGSGSPADRAALGAIRESALDAHRELRDMITVLRSSDRDDITPLPATLEQLDALFARAVGLGSLVVLEGSAVHDGAIQLRTDAVVANTIYRIVHEALTNATTHAPGATITVSIDGGSTDGGSIDGSSSDGDEMAGEEVDGVSDGGVSVTVRNARPEGVASGSPKGSGSGLLIMAERAASVGGTLDVDRGATEWTVRAHLPVRVVTA